MGTFRLASYNIRKCVGLDLRRNPHRTVEVINQLHADIVVLQEADKRLGPRPAALPHKVIEEHSDLRPIEIAQNDVSLGWHGNAVLARKEVGVTNVHRLTLPGLEPRGAVIAEIVLSGTPLRLVGVHLGLMRQSRVRQLAAIRQKLEDLPEMPTVIAGDMNEWSPHVGLESLEEAYDLHAPGHSFHAARPVAGLDRIGHCHSVALKDAGVTENALTRRASDHLPIWADLELTADQNASG